MEKKIQRCDALHEPGLDPGPFRRRNDAGDQIEGKDTLGALRIAVNGERYTPSQERQIHCCAPLFELRRWQRLQPVSETSIVAAHRCRAVLAGKHLVEE